MRTFILAVTGLVFAVVAACSSYGTSVVEVDQESAHVATVSIAVPQSLVAGQTARATATTKDANGTVLTDRPISWSTSSASIASVSSTGDISAVAPGTAVVSAVSEGVAGQATMAVVPPPPAPVAAVAVSLNPSAVLIGQTAQATATLTDASGNQLTDRSVAWESNNLSIATVDAAGTVRAIGAGNATIKASSEGKSNSSVLNVSAPAPVPVATVSVSPPNANLQVGGTVQLSAETRDANNVVLTGRTIGWSSGNTAIATVSSSGLVTARAGGNVSITASSEGRTGSSAITVSAPAPIPVATVSVSPSSASLVVGATTQLSAVTRDANNNVLTGRSITWSSSNSAISTVSTSGLVRAVAAGTATITATSETKVGSSAITVTAPAPVPVATVSVSPSSSSLLVGGTVQLSAVTRDASNNVLTGRTVVWSSSNSAVSTVSASGLVTAIAAGNATITATSETKSGSSTIAVSAGAPAPVATVSVSPSSTSVVVGGTVQLSAVMRDANSNTLTGRSVAWTSSNSAVSTVSASGLVTAVAAGSATITATSETKTGTSAITVTAGSGGSGTCANEPTGMTLISERPFNSLSESSGWDTDSKLSIVTDPAAPLSPNNVIRATYLPGHQTGSEPAHAGIRHTAFAKVYICFAMKLSSNWVGNGTGTNKVLYEWIVNPQKPAFFFSAEGVGGGSLRPFARLQDIAIFPGGNGNLAPNIVPTAQIVRGRWHVVEIFLQGNTSGAANGSIDWYVDGVRVGSVGGIGWGPGNATFNLLEFRPIWGGLSNTPAITQTQTMDWDHVYISGKN